MSWGYSPILAISTAHHPFPLSVPDSELLSGPSPQQSARAIREVGSPVRPAPQPLARTAVPSWRASLHVPLPPAPGATGHLSGREQSKGLQGPS